MGKVNMLLAITIGLVIISVPGGCSSAESSQFKVVTSTSLISQVVERVGGEAVDVVNIIPPAQCPGLFDIKPGDIQQMAEADLFLFHGWQGELFTEEIIAAADNPELTVVVLDIPSNPEVNWMTPAVQKEATDKIAAALSRVDGSNSSLYQRLATQYKEEIEAKANEIKDRLTGKNLASVNVIGSGMQAAFLKWVGLNVVASYGTPETLTPQIIKELVDRGREAGVTLIIDNMQSGQDAGAAIAEELGCTRIILSNFPGGYAGTETWEKAVDENIRLILEATGQ